MILHVRYQRDVNMPQKKLKNVIVQCLKFGLGFGLFTYLLASGRLDLVRIQDALFHSPWVGVAIAMGGGSVVLMAIRWKILLDSQGVTLGLFRALKLVFIGYFFNLVIPGTISGDLIKVYYATRNQEKKMVTGMSVLMDRLVGLVVIISMTFFIMILNFTTVATVAELKMIGQSVMVVFGLMFIGSFFFIFKKNISFSKRLPYILQEPLRVIWAYRPHLKTLFLASLVSIGNYLVSIVMFFAIAKALGENELSFVQYLFLVPVGFFVMSFPITPAGVGIGQGIFLKLFEWTYQRPTTIGADIITLYQLLILCWSVVGLLIYLFNREKKSVISLPKQKEAFAK